MNILKILFLFNKKSEKYNLSLYHLGPSGKVNPSTTILYSLITEKI